MFLSLIQLRKFKFSVVQDVSETTSTVATQLHFGCLNHSYSAKTAGGGGGKLQSHGGERSHRGAEGKAERFPHRGSAPSSTHQPERLVCLAAGAGGAGS